MADEGLFLTGTSEVALAGLHMGEILEREQLPLEYTAFSANFRREAGAAGRDTRGMFRVHQFNKVEMFAYTLPDASWDEFERLVGIEESLVQELGLPYRVVNIAAGQLSAAAAKRIDIEAWFPSQDRYREITSASNTTDYQARRLGIRFRADGGTEFVHTLNGTAVTDRWALAILENFQGEVPEVLRAVRRARASRALGLRAMSCGHVISSSTARPELLAIALGEPTSHGPASRVRGTVPRTCRTWPGSLRRDGRPRLGRAVQGIDCARLVDGVLPAQERLAVAADRVREVLEL